MKETNIPHIETQFVTWLSPVRNFHRSPISESEQSSEVSFPSGLSSPFWFFWLTEQWAFYMSGIYLLINDRQHYFGWMRKTKGQSSSSNVSNIEAQKWFDNSSFFFSSFKFNHKTIIPMWMQNCSRRDHIEHKQTRICNENGLFRS